MITIAERLRPFSTLPGTKVLLPGTSIRLTVYPARIEFDDLSGAQPIHLGVQTLDIKGPVEDFTVQLDLEKGLVRVWGESKSGFFRYHVKANPLTLQWEKGGSEVAISLNYAHQQRQTQPHIERLSLGCHKKQDWELVNRRREMEEIFPFWYHLAQMLPEQPPAIYEGTASLFPACCNAIMADDRNKILEPFSDLFRAGFEGLLSPRLQDTDYNGFDLKPLDSKSKVNPLMLLNEGALLLRSLFIQREKETFKLLPALPVKFHCGRFIHVRCGQKGFLDMEWTKKSIRRIVFLANEDGEILFQFPKETKSFRLRKEGNDQGTKLQAGAALVIRKGETYFLDRFEG